MKNSSLADASAVPPPNCSSESYSLCSGDIERQLRQLDRLAENGMTLAEAIVQAAMSPATPEQEATLKRLCGGNPTLALSRAARVVTQAVAQGHKIAEAHRVRRE